MSAAPTNPVKAAPAAAAAPKASAPVPIGLLPNGQPVFAPFQPSVASLALTLTPFLTNADPLDNVLPLPRGISLRRAPAGVKGLQLVVEPFFAVKLRRVFGYVGEITLTDGDGTDTPAQLQIVIKIPWRYGTNSAETGQSWMLARLVAFVSKSLFAQPAQVVKLGSCVVGFLEPSSGAASSCQLVGWDVCPYETWRSLSPSTVPTQWDLNMDAIFCIPQLAATNFNYTRLPHVIW